MCSNTAYGPTAARSSTSGAIVYSDYRDNFVVWPGRGSALHDFVNQTYAGQRHKLRHTRSSNSEDALTWLCFDTLNCVTGEPRNAAMANLWWLAFDDIPAPPGFRSGQIFVGKRYGEPREETEVDASIEGDGFLVFIEAKLYSPMSLADEENRKPHDQLARKLRVGLKEAQRTGKTFYLIILDIAPKEILRGLKPGASLADARGSTKPKPGGFAAKWLTAYWFSRYKGGASVTPLREVLHDIPDVDARTVAANMGWLTWSDVFKTVLRATIAAGSDRTVPPTRSLHQIANLIYKIVDKRPRLASILSSLIQLFRK